MSDRTIMPKRGVASSYAASSGDVHSAETDAFPDDTHPCDMFAGVQQRGDALTLARQARAQSGSVHSIDAPAISLSDAEFEKALDYCKHEFHERFMLNEDLRREYTKFRNEPDCMTRSQKTRYAKSFAERFAIG